MLIFQFMFPKQTNKQKNQTKQALSSNICYITKTEYLVQTFVFPRGWILKVLMTSWLFLWMLKISKVSIYSNLIWSKS